MASAFGVTADDVAARLPQLFPGGFTVDTRPSLAVVETMIDSADAIVSFRTSTIQGAFDDASVPGREYIITTVAGQVVGVLYAAADPVAMASAVKPYRDIAKDQLALVDAMIARNLEKQSGDRLQNEQPFVRVSSGSATRAGPHFSERRF